jgi:hypothetical protein
MPLSSAAVVLAANARDKREQRVKVCERGLRATAERMEQWLHHLLFLSFSLVRFFFLSSIGKSSADCQGRETTGMEERRESGTITAIAVQSNYIYRTKATERQRESHNKLKAQIWGLVYQEKSSNVRPPPFSIDGG